MPRLLRARAPFDQPQRGAQARPARARALGRTRVGVRGRCAAGGSGHLRARHPDARHLLRDAGHGAGARRQGRADRRLRVRQDGVHRRGRRALREPAGGADRLDEPPRLGHARRRRAARVVASSQSTPITAFEDPERRLYGVQFHPEVVHTPYGNDLLKNFLYSVADAPPTWTAAAVIEEQVERIRAQVGDAARAVRALGRSGLRGRRADRAQGHRRPAHLRLRRPRPAAERRGRAGRRDVRQPLRRAARPRPRPGPLPRQLAGVTDPEEKRKRSATSSSASSSARPRSSARSASSCRARSTPTSSSPAGATRPRSRATTTSAGCPRTSTFELVEPLRQLFKDEVRRGGRGARAARADGLAPALPGPGARDPHHRRGHARAARHPAPGRLRAPGGGPPRRPLPRPLAELRGAARRSARSASRATSAPTPIRS